MDDLRELEALAVLFNMLDIDMILLVDCIWPKQRMLAPVTHRTDPNTGRAHRNPSN